MNWLTQLSPEIIITAIVFGAVGLLYALWIIRQQQRDLKEIIKNDHKHFQLYLQANTQALIEMRESVKENTEFTKEACKLIREIKMPV